ncbi:MAG: HipA domain-containing protein [Sphingomonas sp.]
MRAAIAALLRRTADPAAAIDAFLRATFFNLMIGNTDNHAKNHALTYDVGPVPRLAPLYDLVPIRLSERHNHLFAFSIGDALQAEQLTSNDLTALMASFGLRPAAAARFARNRIAPMIAALARLDAPDGWDPLFNILIDTECARLVTLLAEIGTNP